MKCRQTYIRKSENIPYITFHYFSEGHHKGIKGKVSQVIFKIEKYIFKHAKNVHHHDKWMTVLKKTFIPNGDILLLWMKDVPKAFSSWMGKVIIWNILFWTKFEIIFWKLLFWILIYTCAMIEWFYSIYSILFYVKISKICYLFLSIDIG